ncbi:MAG: hypothetical protein ACJAZ2_001243 [Glaciecola sp.]|jgi:hypothetical protein
MKKQKLAISISAIILMFFLLRTCTKKSESPQDIPEVKLEESYVSPPFSKVRIPRVYFEIDVSKDTVITFGSTTIAIPSCAFIDSNKQVVTGKVRLSYREVNSPAAILVSGVPMRLSENGKEVLESAGMMELLVQQNSQAVFPNPDCLISVTMKSKQKGKDYNLYSLDTVGKQWKEVEKDIPVIAAKKEKVSTPNFEEMALKKGIIKPVKPVLENKKLFQFKFKMDFSKYPELNIYNGVEWEFVGRKRSENPDKNPWVKTAYWNEMEIVKRKRNGVYKLKLTSNGKVFKTTVKPVFKEGDMEYATFVFEEKYEKYRAFVQKQKDEIAKEKARREKVAEARKVNDSVSRKFALQGFGWTNIDRIMKEEQVAIEILFKGKNGEEIKAVQVYLFMEGINSVITYGGRNLKNFKYGVDRKCKLVVIGEDAVVYNVGSKQFSKIKGAVESISFTLMDKVEVGGIEDVVGMVGE